MNPLEEVTESLLRDGGDAEALIPRIDVVFDVTEQPLPVLTLEEGWDPSTAGDLEIVRDAVRRGVGLQCEPVREFDFAWLDDALPYLRYLHCAGDQRAYLNLEAIAEMESLISLTAPPVDHAIDLTGSRELRWLSVTGNGMLSAARAPKLQTLWLDTSEVPWGTVFSPSVRWASLILRTLRNVEFAAMTSLERLTLKVAKEVDLRVVSSLSRLS